MSTTAGVSSSEYVAINTAAVWSAVLGLCSLFALFEDILLIIPLVALIFGIVAWRQISRSNGTESGRIWASIGIALALSIMSWRVFHQITEHRRNTGDMTEISSVIVKLGEDIKADQLDAAYDLFDDRFKEQVDHDRFVKVLRSLRSNPAYGNLLGLQSNGLVDFMTSPDPTYRFAQTKMVARFDKEAEPPTPTMVLRHANGAWQIEGIPDLFPPPPPAQKGPGR